MLLEKLKNLLKEDGFLVTSFFVYHFLKRHLGKKELTPYQKWIMNYEKEEKKQEKFLYSPVISIIVPVYNVQKSQLVECIESVRRQTYKNWQLCMVDDASSMPEVKETLQKYEGIDNIKIHYRKENGHISRTTNDGLALADGEFIGLLDCDDILSENALYEMVKKLNEKDGYDFVYSDEDLITEDGKERYSPVFKGDWCPDTLMSIMYTNHFSIFRKCIVDDIGGYRIGFEGSQDYDFVLRFTERTKKIGHVNKILYHWRARQESVAFDPETKMYAYEAAQKAKMEALERRGWLGRTEYLPTVYQSRIIYEYKEEPLVSVVIPSKDNPQYFSRCVKGIRENTDYKNIEIVLVDNGSNEKNKKEYETICETYHCICIYESMVFNFSKMCNIGAKVSRGELLLFLNDDIEVIDGKWLSRMVGHALLPHTGAVGAKLYYPNSKLIQHIGIINTAAGPEHFWGRMPEDSTGYRMMFEYNYSAVTGACMMIERKKYQEVGGWDEEFPIAYNDVELCFKLVEAEYYNVVRCDAVLVHHESVSRGMDKENIEKTERLLEDKKRLYIKHPQFKQYDTSYTSHDLDVYNLPNLASCKPLEIPKQTVKAERIQRYLDMVPLTQMGKLKLFGQYTIVGSRMNLWNSVYIVLQNGEENYCYKTKKWYLSSQKSQFSHKTDVLSGFYGLIDTKKIKKGTYIVKVIGVHGLLRKKILLCESNVVIE